MHIVSIIFILTIPLLCPALVLGVFIPTGLVVVVIVVVVVVVVFVVFVVFVGGGGGASTACLHSKDQVGRLVCAYITFGQ